MRLKNDLYKDEQNGIIDKIIKIIDLDECNSLMLYDIDKDKKKQAEILELLPEIRKYFSLSHIDGFRTPEKYKRPYMTIIKHTIKNKYKMLSCDHRIKKDSGEIRTKRYIFVKKK